MEPIFDAGKMIINIRDLIIDDARCFQTIRALRWPEGVRCARCGSPDVIKHGRDETQRNRQKYYCKDCSAYFSAMPMSDFDTNPYCF